MEEKNFTVCNDLLGQGFSINSSFKVDPVLYVPKDKYLKVVQPNFEYQYANSLRRLLKEGVEKENRTGTNTLSVHHQYFFLENVDKMFPRIKGKKVFPTMALVECLWMMYGRTDIKWLQDHKVNYWNDWALLDGTIGNSYGKQFRDFNGVDQLQDVIDLLLLQPTSRRIVMNLWNVSDLPKMSLPPCFYDFHFCCMKNPAGGWLVDLSVRSRSEDSFIGQPYDFMFVAWFLTIICNYLNTKSQGIVYTPNNIHYTADDYHLYVNHIEQVKEYLKNVEENNQDLIDSVCKTQSMLPIVIDNKDYKIEDYLDFITPYENNDLHIWITKNMKGNTPIAFEYGQIKAPIAI